MTLLVASAIIAIDQGDPEHIMSIAYRHLALFVPDLEAAEMYYRNLFAMTVITREAADRDGTWQQLPPDKGWAEAKAANIKLGMVALQHDAFVLALFPGDPQPGQIFVIGVQMPDSEIEAVRARLTPNDMVLDTVNNQLLFMDRHMVSWQLVPEGAPFQGAGDAHGHWLDL